MINIKFAVTCMTFIYPLSLDERNNAIQADSIILESSCGIEYKLLSKETWINLESNTTLTTNSKIAENKKNTSKYLFLFSIKSLNVIDFHKQTIRINSIIIITTKNT